jgi:hypothetical protein
MQGTKGIPASLGRVFDRFAPHGSEKAKEERARPSMNQRR